MVILLTAEQTLADQMKILTAALLIIFEMSKCVLLFPQSSIGVL